MSREASQTPISEKKKYRHRKLTRNQYMLIKAALSEPGFMLMKELASQLDKNYISLVRSARSLVLGRDYLGLRISPYRAGLDRYLVIFRLKEGSEKKSALEVAMNLPHNHWVKSITINTNPMGEVRIFYLIPIGEDINKIVEKIYYTDLVDKDEKISVYKMNLTYYQVLDLDKFYSDQRKGPMSLKEVLSIIEKEELLEPDMSELEDMEPKPPPDFIDVMLMSLLEVKYVFSPKWLSKGGPLRIGIKSARYHYFRHIRDKYVLGAYVKRPLDPNADLSYSYIIKGGETLKLGYTLSRTPYAYVLCDPLNVCLINFWIRSEDLKLVEEFMNSYNVRIVKQAQRVVLREEAEGRIIRSLRVGFPFQCYAIKGRRWYTLKEAEENIIKNIKRIEKKIKDKSWARFFVPSYVLAQYEKESKSAS